jgi:hypothetical protein
VAFWTAARISGVSVSSAAIAKGLIEASKPTIDNTAKIFPDFVFMIGNEPK